MKGFKKMGLMFMAMVIALVGIGAAYASWTDTLTITGTVNTGNVDLEIKYLSATYVYKDMAQDSHANVTVSIVTDAATGAVHSQEGTAPANYLLVAYGNATADIDGDTINFEFDNLFPCIDFWVDAKLQYVGSIPVRIDTPIVWTTDGDDAQMLQHLIDRGHISLEIRSWDPQSHQKGEEELTMGDQLHEDDWIWVGVRVHIPQEAHGEPTDQLMGLDGGFSVELDVIQWNEYNNQPG